MLRVQEQVVKELWKWDVGVNGRGLLEMLLRRYGVHALDIAPKLQYLVTLSASAPLESRLLSAYFKALLTS